MAIRSVSLREFSVFPNATFEFAEGINVLIGGNSTGKTHVMKLAYAATRAFRPRETTLKPSAVLEEKLARVFLPDSQRIGRLVRRQQGQNNCSVSVEYRSGEQLRFTLHTKGSSLRLGKAPRTTPDSIFLPSREVLALYEGFVAAYERRELSFDETYADVALALSLPAARGPRADIASAATLIEKAIGGKVSLDGPRFYLRLAEGKFEAHLVAEGYRRLATVLRLIINGALTKDTVLFWDEPEANLNPVLSEAVARVIAGLAGAGVQVILATHDYLMASRLSLLASEANGPATRFFSLSRSSARSGVSVSAGDSLDEIEPNLLLEAMVNYADFERAQFTRALGGDDEPRKGRGRARSET